LVSLPIGHAASGGALAPALPRATRKQPEFVPILVENSFYTKGCAGTVKNFAGEPNTEMGWLNEIVRAIKSD